MLHREYAYLFKMRQKAVERHVSGLAVRDDEFP